MGIDYLEIARRALADRKPSVLGTKAELQVGVYDVHSAIPISDTRVDEALRHVAVDILNRVGARLFFSGGDLTVGIWALADGLEVRAAIRTLYSENIRVIHLEEAPARYRGYKPEHLKTRQDLIPGDATGIPGTEWEKRRLDRLFREAEIARNAPDTKNEINERNEKRPRGNDTTERHVGESCDPAVQANLFNSRRTGL